MSQVIVNIEVIVKRDDRYLMIVRSDDEDFGGGWLCFPGGKLDPGAAEMHVLELTAQRELMEEVALDADVASFRYVESHTFMIGSETVVDIVMLTEDARGEPVAVDASEVADLRWMTADEVMSDPRAQSFTRESLQMAVAMNAGGA